MNTKTPAMQRNPLKSMTPSKGVQPASSGINASPAAMAKTRRSLIIGTTQYSAGSTVLRATLSKRRPTGGQISAGGSSPKWRR